MAKIVFTGGTGPIYTCDDKRVKSVNMSYGGIPDEQGRLNTGVVLHFKDGTQKYFYRRTNRKDNAFNEAVADAEQFLNS
jgi:hypothetical protein